MESADLMESYFSGYNSLPTIKDYCSKDIYLVNLSVKKLVSAAGQIKKIKRCLYMLQRKTEDSRKTNVIQQFLIVYSNRGLRHYNEVLNSNSDLCISSLAKTLSSSDFLVKIQGKQKYWEGIETTKICRVGILFNFFILT
jgi:hypothetical protein